MFPESYSQLPGYVINIPMVVSSDEEEGYSSDEELDGNFAHECFDNPQEYIRLHPQKGSSKPLRGHILEVITPEFSNKPQSKKIQDFWEKLHAENQHMKGSLLYRIRIVIGLNKMRSLSTSRNQSLTRELNCGNGRTLIRKIGFLWDGRWEKKIGKNWVEVTYEHARKFYKQLKKIDPELAETYRKDTEQAEVYKKDPEKRKKIKVLQIPYREIRDTVKNHPLTKQATNELQAQKIKSIFLLFLDGDLQSFRSSKSIGPFATIDDLSKNPNIQIISTGYVVEEAKNRALELGVLADLVVRKATAKFIKNGVYYPEPCTAVKISEKFDTVTEDFSDGTSVYESPKEMPLLIEKVLRARRLNPQTSMEFDTNGAIVTETPNRMRRKFKSQINKERKLISWGLSDFETMRGINQSHYNSRDWAQYLLLGVKLKTKITLFEVTLQDRNSIRDCAVSLLSRIFNAFDPVEQAKGDSFQQKFISILKDDNESIVNQIQPHTKGREFKGKNKEDKEKLWNELDAIDSLEKLENAICETLKEPNNFPNIRSAVKEINKELINLFKTALSLDFEEIIKNTLHELTGINELPAVFQKIIRRELFLKKDLSCKNSLSLLHIAAIAGNKEAIPQLLKREKDLSQVDSKGRYPFEYGLIYCKNNGLDLPLLEALLYDKISQVANKLVYKYIPNIPEQIQILEFLINKFGDDVICSYNSSLFFEAVYRKNNRLAEQLAKHSPEIGKDLANEVLTKAPNWNHHLRSLLKYIDTKNSKHLYEKLSVQNRLHLDEFYRLHDPHEFKHFIIKNIDTEGVNQDELEKEFFKAVYEKDETKIEEFAHRNDFSIPIAIQHELVRAEVWKDELGDLACKYYKHLNYAAIKIELKEDLYSSFVIMLKEYINFFGEPSLHKFSTNDYYANFSKDEMEYICSPIYSNSSASEDLSTFDDSSSDDLMDIISIDRDVEMSDWSE